MRSLIAALAALVILAAVGCGNSAAQPKKAAIPSPPTTMTSSPSVTNNVDTNAKTGNNPAPHGINLNYVSSSGTQARADIDAIHAAGFTGVRLAIVDWGDDPEGVAVRDNHWHPVAEYALGFGMRVIYGLSHNPPLAADNEDRYAQAVLKEAVWAQSLRNPNLSLCEGNEDELHSSLSPAALRDFMRKLAIRVKQTYTFGPISYSSSSYPEHIKGWADEGIGQIDQLGFNIYYSDHGQFQGVIDELQAPTAKFHGHVEITEWSIDHGFTGNDATDTPKIADAVQTLKKTGLATYFYNYRDENPDEGTYGVLRTGTKNSYHGAWKILTAA